MSDSPIELNEEQKARLSGKVKDYVNNELGQDIGTFDAEFLIDFIAQAIGPALYNRGIQDARQLFAEKAEEFDYQVQELEQLED